MNHYQRTLARYQSGQTPWDHPEPPPEVMAFASTLPPGRALDLGCGPGRASIYLARLGWQVDGVDFIPDAIEIAQVRAKEAGVSPCFHLAPVTALDFLTGPYDFALDVGCLHNLSDDDLRRYHQQLLRLLKPGGAYLLFAHLRETDSTSLEGRRWLDERAFRRLFQRGFTLERLEYGTTQVGDNPPWKSAWFWYQKTYVTTQPQTG